MRNSVSLWWMKSKNQAKEYSVFIGRKTQYCEKMSALPNLIYRCGTILHYTTDIDKLTLKFISEKLKTQNSENITEAEKKRTDTS